MAKRARKRRASRIRAQRAEAEAAQHPPVEPAGRAKRASAPSEPEPDTAPAGRRQRMLLWAAAGGAGLALAPFPPYTILSLLVLAFALRQHIAKGVRRLPFGPRTTLALAIVLSGLVLEALSWLRDYLENDPRPELLHPQLGPDLLMSFGFAAGWAAAWLLALHWYRFSMASAAAIHGGYGVVVERSGASLTGGPLSAVLVFVLYAGTLAFAWVLASGRLDELPQGRGTRWTRFLAAGGLLAVATLLAVLVWGTLLIMVGVLPEKASIRARPFW